MDTIKSQWKETSRLKSKPNPWPKAQFIIIRFLQLVFSLVPLAVSGYFSLALKSEGYGVPWQFAIMAAAGALTLIDTLGTSIAVCANALSPIVAMVADWIILPLWLTSWASLASAMKSNLTSSCTTKAWGDSVGIKVCSSYKAAFAFCLVETALFCLTIIIATSVRSHVSRVKYVAMNPSGTAHAGIPLESHAPYNHSRNESVSGPFSDANRASMVHPSENPFNRNSHASVDQNPFAGGTDKSYRDIPRPASHLQSQSYSSYRPTQPNQPTQPYGYNDPLGQEDRPVHR